MQSVKSTRVHGTHCQNRYRQDPTPHRWTVQHLGRTRRNTLVIRESTRGYVQQSCQSCQAPRLSSWARHALSAEARSAANNTPIPILLHPNWRRCVHAQIERLSEIMRYYGTLPSRGSARKGTHARGKHTPSPLHAGRAWNAETCRPSIAKCEPAMQSLRAAATPVGRLTTKPGARRGRCMAP